MRSSFLVIPLALLPVVASAVPARLTWQGRLLDPLGAPIDGTREISVRLFDDPVGSDPIADLLHAETVTTAVADGYVSIVLGAAGDLDAGDLAGDVWLEIAVDGAALSPRTLLSDSPRAAVTVTAGNGLRIGTTDTCDATTFGTLRFHESGSTGALQICTAGQWKTITTAGATEQFLVADATARRWSDGSAAPSCDAYRHPALGYAYSGATGDGAYWIQPPGQPEFAVYCDMSFEGRGWTLVARGLGGSTAGWLTTGSLNTTAATSGSSTFKFDDARINAIPKVMYRFVGAGTVNQDWYWDAAACPAYAHTTASTGGCNTSFRTSALTSPLVGAANAGHLGLGDWTGTNQDHLHTGHSSGGWYIRDNLSDENGAVCNGTQGGCNVWLYVR